MIGAGSDYILMLLSIILGTDHTVAFEDPTYMQAFRLAGDLGYQRVAVPVNRDGMQVAALMETGADIAYVTPSHQYPTGIVMPVRRRMELLRWAGDGTPAVISLRTITTVSSAIKANPSRPCRATTAGGR